MRRSKESAARTVSLEDQRTRIEAYCQEREWSLAEIVADDGVSGGRRERPERLAERVKVTGARVIIVYHLDRFARDLAATSITCAASLGAEWSSMSWDGAAWGPTPPPASSRRR